MLTKYQNANSKLGLGSKPVAVIYALTRWFFSPSRPCVVHSIQETPLPQVQRGLSARPPFPLVDRNRGQFLVAVFMPQAFPSTSSSARTSQA